MMDAIRPDMAVEPRPLFLVVFLVVVGRELRRISVADDSFHTVARVGEIPEGQGRPFEVEGVLVAVFLEQGHYYALEDSCPHQGAPLSDGILFDKCVTCTWHGWRFSLEDGHWMDSKKSKVRVPTYPVRVVGDEIQVSVRPGHAHAEG